MAESEISLFLPCRGMFNEVAMETTFLISLAYFLSGYEPICCHLHHMQTHNHIKLKKKHTFKEIGIYSFNKYILPLTMSATVEDTGKVLRITWLHHGYSSCTQRHKTGYSSKMHT